MTREEAINLLADMDSDKYTAKEAVALTMAIKALGQEPIEMIHGSTYGGASWGGTYKSQQPNDDVISKQAVCDFCSEHEAGDTLYTMTSWDGGIGFDYINDIKYCPLCGRKLERDKCFVSGNTRMYLL